MPAQLHTIIIVYTVQTQNYNKDDISISNVRKLIQMLIIHVILEGMKLVEIQ